MKKYGILFLITAVILSAIVLIGDIAERSQQIETISLQRQTVRRTVSCKGRIIEAGQRCVYTELPVIAGNIYIEEGQFVRKGDLLFDINTEATAKAFLSAMENGKIDSEKIISVMGSIGADSVSSQILEQAEGKDFATLTRLFSSVIPQSYTTPVSGYVRQINLSQKNLNQTAQPAVVIASEYQLQVELSVGEGQISQIKYGQTAILTGSGFSPSVYTGKVSFISSYASQEYSGLNLSTSLKVVIKVDNYQKNFKAGLSVNADIITEEKEEQLLVPYEVIRSDGKGNEYMYLVENGKIVKRQISVDEEFPEGCTVRYPLLSEKSVIVEKPDEVILGKAVVVKREE